LEEHETYLAERIGLKEDPERTITWDMFYKKTATGRSFYEWFAPIMEYVAKYPAIWDSGMILGFASKRTVQTMLSSAAITGQSFVIFKFSERHAGKMVASYNAWTPQRGHFPEHVLFDGALFRNRSIVECVKMSPDLQSVNRILPCNATLAEFYSLETIQSEARGTVDCYVTPRIAFIWGNEPVAPAYEAVAQVLEDVNIDDLETILGQLD